MLAQGDFSNKPAHAVFIYPVSVFPRTGLTVTESDSGTTVKVAVTVCACADERVVDMTIITKTVSGGLANAGVASATAKSHPRLLSASLLRTSQRILWKRT